MNIIYLILYIIICFTFIARRPRLIIFIPFIVSNFLSLISLFLIENGSYITEQDLYGYENNSSILFFIFSIISLLIFYWGSNRINLILSRKNCKTIFFLIEFPFFLILLYIITNKIFYDRFSFFNYDGILTNILNYYNIASVAAYYYCALKEESKFKRYVYFISMITFEFLKSSEFSGQLTILYIFIISEFIANKTEINFIKTSKYLISLIIFMIILLFYKMSFYEGYEEQLLNRLSLQSHLFWGVLNLSSTPNFIYSISNAFKHLFNFSPGLPDSTFGLGELMYTLSGELANTFLQNGVEFAGGYPSVFIYYYGLPASYVIHVLLTFLVIYYTKLFYFIVNNCSILIFILFFKISSMVLIQPYTTGGIWFLNGRNALLSILLLSYLYTQFTKVNKKII